jgi:formylglycine-generating enzyme required for sulfatase activity
VLSGRLRPRGVGAFLCGRSEELGDDFAAFLAGQAALDARAGEATDFPARTAVRTPVRRTRPYRRQALPAEMVPIPGASLRMTTRFRVRECGFYEAQSEPLGSGRLPLHGPHAVERHVDLAPYAVDRWPVTNGQFAAFLGQSGYRPRHPESFLRHWRDGAPPPGMEEHPVVYVDLDDTRAYARWVGKRLPSEEEWQYAAQGPDGRRYPWGEEARPGLCNGGESGTTTSVFAFPEGRSPFGCEDMCGNVWEWTESERRDGRTRFSMLRGGSFYRAEGSDWYLDGGARPADFAAKFLLSWPGLDRCATIGFRCAVDLAEPD